MRKHLAFITAFIIVTIVFGTIYATVQQTYRQGANDPQIQLAEDGARTLAAGGSWRDLTGISERNDLEKSLRPFTQVYDAQGQGIVSSGNIKELAPEPPAGVLEYARAHGENRLTWQPSPDVRLATVVVYYQGSSQSGYVLVARSLREVEERESKLGFIIEIAYLVSLAVLALALIIRRRYPNSNH